MSKVSVIIPSRNERFLPNTVADLLAKAGGDIEIIAVLDGYWPDPPLPEDKRLIQLHRGTPMGMRAAINSAAEVAKGKYLMKCDAHCMFDEGWDVKLQADCDGDWVVVPRRKRLDAENWCIQDVGKPDVDYEFLSHPYWKPDQVGIHGTIWTERILARRDPQYDIDEDMSFQGSCWFTPTQYFRDLIGPLQEEGYGSFIGEPQEIGLKAWLGGGKQIRNKKTWYAHLHKGKTYGRGYSLNKRELVAGNAYSVNFWMRNLWDRRVHDIQWLVERFYPVPTWPEDRATWTL